VLGHTRTVPIGSCEESVGEHVVDDRVCMPSLPAEVVRQFYFAQLAYEIDAEMKQCELQRLFRIFGEYVPPSSSGSSSSAADGAIGYVEPWFWQALMWKAMNSLTSSHQSGTWHFAQVACCTW